MPPIEVVLQQESSWITTWGPVIGSALVAVATVVGVLVGSKRTSESAAKTAEKNSEATLGAAKRSAQALLDVENHRIDTEHRRHVRSLIAELSTIVMRRVELMRDLANGVTRVASGETLVGVLNQSMHDFGRATTLIILTTSNGPINDAVRKVVAAESAARSLANLGSEQSNALRSAVGDLATACGVMSGTAAAVLTPEPVDPLGL